MAGRFLGKVIELRIHEVWQLKIYEAKKLKALEWVGKKCCYMLCCKLRIVVRPPLLSNTVEH